MRTAPRRHESVSAIRSRTRTSCSEPLPMSRTAPSQVRRVHRREVAAAPPPRAREHADRETLARAGPGTRPSSSPRGWRSSRRRRSSSPSSSGAGEVGEHLDRRARAHHALLAERARLVHAGADAHRLVDLVRALPPAAEARRAGRMNRRRPGGRSWTRGRRPRGGRQGTFDELDPVPVRIAHEALKPGRSAHRVRRLSASIPRSRRFASVLSRSSAVIAMWL